MANSTVILPLDSYDDAGLCELGSDTVDQQLAELMRYARDLESAAAAAEASLAHPRRGERARMLAHLALGAWLGLVHLLAALYLLS